MQKDGADAKYYYRTVAIDYSYFSRWLNLPEGFKVVSAFNDLERAAYALRVDCPPEEQYQVHPHNIIPEVIPTARVFDCDHVQIFWPDLGQDDPEECGLCSHRKAITDE